MFEVIFKVHPRLEAYETYLSVAKSLKPELEQIVGFVSNVRYKSLMRQGWILSLSEWVDEKALVRWRTQKRHHEAQERGRGEILTDYHLRVGQATADDGLPAPYKVTKQRVDHTEIGDATHVVLINSSLSNGLDEHKSPSQIVGKLGVDLNTSSLVK